MIYTTNQSTTSVFTTNSTTTSVFTTSIQWSTYHELLINSMIYTTDQSTNVLHKMMHDLMQHVFVLCFLARKRFYSYIYVFIHLHIHLYNMMHDWMPLLHVCALFCRNKLVWIKSEWLKQNIRMIYTWNQTDVNTNSEWFYANLLCSIFS